MKMKFRSACVPVAFCWIALLASCPPATAADESKRDVSLLTVDRIYNGSEFKSKSDSARWLKGGDYYTTLEPSADHKQRHDIVRHDPASGKTQVVVAAADLIPPGESTPLKIEEYAWSRDQSKLLVYTNSKRVWRRNTRGDYWLLDRASKQLRKLGGDAKPATLMFAKFSPNAQQVAFVRDGNIYVEDLFDHSVKCVTRAESSEVINGTTDWVYEEEFGLRDGFRWSPDGRRIAFWQLDTELVSEFVLVNYTAELYPQLTRFPYPKAGEINPAARIGTIAAGGGEITWAAFQGSPRDFYLARMEWASPNELIVQRVNRRQNGNDVMRVAAASGETDRLFLEEDEAWVDVRDDLHWIELGESFTWVSERDGWRRAYRIDGGGANQRPLSPLAKQVDQAVKKFHGDGGRISDFNKIFQCGAPRSWVQRTYGDASRTVDADQQIRRRHTSELQSRRNLVCRLLLEKKKKNDIPTLHEQDTRLLKD